MIFPTASDTLRCIDQTLLDASDLDMPRTSAKSALATCRHLIRHVELRLQLEPSILINDISTTTALLNRIAAYLESAGKAAADVSRSIRITLTEAPALLLGKADDLERIRAQTLVLREQVYAGLAYLQSMDAATKATKTYSEIRGLIRDYISYELAQEAQLIRPAFAGRGPRR